MADKKKEYDLSSEFEYVLDVNKKAVEIHVEVARQNEDVLESLERIENKVGVIVDKQRDHLDTSNDSVVHVEDIKENIEEMGLQVAENTDSLKEIEKKIEDIEKNFFRLIIVLTSLGIGTIVEIIQAFLHR